MKDFWQKLADKYGWGVTWAVRSLNNQGHTLEQSLKHCAGLSGLPKNPTPENVLDSKSTKEG